jgi:hypothetical protein
MIEIWQRCIPESLLKVGEPLFAELTVASNADQVGELCAGIQPNLRLYDDARCCDSNPTSPRSSARIGC